MTRTCRPVTNSANVTRSCTVEVQVPICNDFGTACSVGVGECAASGVRVCTGLGMSTCNATAGTPTAELCDGLDNNCDGQILDSEIGCALDLNGDAVITVSDVLTVLSEFGCDTNCAADITGDGAVTVSDVLALLSGFGTAC